MYVLLQEAWHYHQEQLYRTLVHVFINMPDKSICDVSLYTGVTSNLLLRLRSKKTLLSALEVI